MKWRFFTFVFVEKLDGRTNAVTVTLGTTRGESASVLIPLVIAFGEVRARKGTFSFGKRHFPDPERGANGDRKKEMRLNVSLLSVGQWAR